MSDRPTILGLDLGTNSIGWALLSARSDNGSLHPDGIVAAGVRIFQAGMDGDIGAGREESRAKARRDARLARRQTERRMRRLRGVFNALRSAGLLPTYPDLDSSSAARHQSILRLDHAIRESGRLEVLADTIGVEGAADKLPYILRAAALDHPLEPHELGRAMYHLAQRRGFLSNRRTPRRDDEEGIVMEGISELRDDMARTSSRTLGEHLSRIDPHQRRIRQRYTARAMLIDEFEAIWASQERFHPELLTPELRKKVYHRIFHQRPLKSQSDKIGRCELEPKRRRAPWAILAAQRFRILQAVNNLRIIDEHGAESELTAEQRATLVSLLDERKELTFTRVRRVLKAPNATFNLERGGEKRLVGNATNAALAKVFGDRWWGFDLDTRNAIIEDLLSIQKAETLERRGREVWGLEEEKAREFADTRLPNGYCHFSRRALANLLPHLEEGLNIQLAIEKAYPDHRRLDQAHDLLPPVKDVLPDLTNPAVTRTLTELRKVVNAILKRHGRPAVIRVELGRDLRRSRAERQRLQIDNRRLEVMRKAAAEEIRAFLNDEPTARDIEKLLLAKECEFTCPYTGRKFNMAALFGPEPQVDVEHIIPFHLSLDNSYLNKTLCFADENRNVKRGRTPFEAYGDTPRWNDILERVSRFKSRLAPAKLHRFKLHGAELEEWLADFSSRQLNDTRFASRLAVRYLSLLYGGTTDGVDPQGKRRITVVTGATTAHVRNWLQMGAILHDGGEKSRDDHRHHAVDAIAVALTNHGTVRALSIASRNQLLRRGRLYGDPEPPWPTFLDDVRATIADLVVSPRVERRVRGSLHGDTFYSPRSDEGAKSAEGRYVHYTKRLADLSPSMVEKIVDPTVRRLVIEALNGGVPKDVFKDESRLPRFVKRNGKSVPIRKVRIRDKISVAAVGTGERQRFVQTGANHHLEVFEVSDAKGTTRWEGRVVTMLEAYDRVRKGLPVVNREHDSGGRFLFSIVSNPGGDVIELDEPDGSRRLYVVESIWMAGQQARVRISPLNQATARNTRTEPRINVLGQRSCRKVAIDPLGTVTYAND